MRCWWGDRVVGVQRSDSGCTEERRCEGLNMGCNTEKSRMTTRLLAWVTGSIKLTSTEMKRTEGSRLVGKGAQSGIRQISDIHWARLGDCAVGHKCLLSFPYFMHVRVDLRLDLTNKMWVKVLRTRLWFAMFSTFPPTVISSVPEESCSIRLSPGVMTT